MDAILKSLAADVESLTRLTPRLTAALLVLLFAVLLGRAMGRGVQEVLRRTGRAGQYESAVYRMISWTVSLLGLVVALHVLGLTSLATSLLATGGFAAVIFGFAFRDIGENLLAGLFLAFSRSFDVGDLIQSSDLLGRVQSIDLRHVHIRTADGCDIFIPSSQIFRNALYNFTRDGLRRGTFTVGIDYADDAERARSTLLEAVGGIDGVLDDPPAEVHIAGFTPSYVEMQVFFWIDTFRRGLGIVEVRTRVMDACRTALLAEGFTVSAEVTTSLRLAPLDVALSAGGGGGGAARRLGGRPS